MKINELLANELTHEKANTARLLERIPQDKLDWRPHRKSWTMAELATHIANLPGWTALTMQQDEFDIAPIGVEAPTNPTLTSVADLLKKLDETTAEALAVLRDSDEAEFQKSWKMLSGGNEVFTMPKIVVMRSFIMNHIVHHRAQLTVYLRMNDVPLPPIYGPTADEGGM